ncbi:hypothetical protein HMPREF3025_08985 [Neisseria sp. HMSC070E12]|nr:hypothetical protein HMPREF2638_08835 [Neisseria sp. HMSC055F11]OHR40109.1 hypothetical protein HMPREF3025_08985 [Neisseria sp. HMSC070E12]
MQLFEIKEDILSLYRDISGNNELTLDLDEIQHGDNKYLKINDYILIPVYSVNSPYLVRTTDAMMKKFLLSDASNDVIGHLIVIQKELAFDYYKFSQETFECFLAENFYEQQETITPEQLKNYKFKIDFLYFKKTKFSEYMSRYFNSSEIWGGFSHRKTNLLPHTHRENNFEIKLPDIDNIINYPTTQNENKMISAIYSTDSFDRFLKIYHQLEVFFYLLHIKEIQRISIDDYYRINDIFKDINKGEIDSIKYIFQKYPLPDSQIINISTIFNKSIQNYKDLSCEIFFKFGKESNPLKDKISWDIWINDIAPKLGNNIDLDTESKKYTYGDKKIFKSVNSIDTLKKFTTDLAIYWIYRIRCSIAHYKFGEFLFEKEHEPFVLEIGEPILREMIIGLFSNKDFHALFEKTST